MIDVEQSLRDSLHAYIDAFDPGPPPETVPLTARPRTSRRWVAVAAAALVVVGGGAAWSASRDDRDPPPTDGPDPSAVPVSPGTWSVPAASDLSIRQNPTVAWTGSEFLVWGGGPLVPADGAFYDPTADTWRPMAANPEVIPDASGTWAGDRFVVVWSDSAAAYDPATDTWERLAWVEPFDPTAPFTDVVWTGSDLLGISIVRNDTGSAARMTVRRLVDQTWVAEDEITVTDAFPASRYTVDGRYVHQPIALPDGFALWDRDRAGWRFTIGEGWSRLPDLAQYDDDVLISDGRLVAVGGELVVLANGKTAETDDLRVARLVQGAWSDWTVVDDRAPLGWSAVAAGDRIVVLDTSDGRGTPRLVDPASGTSTWMTGYPITTVIDRGAAWSGSHLLVFGGQRTTGSPASSTDAAAASSAAALWTPTGIEGPAAGIEVDDTVPPGATATDEQIRRFAVAVADGANPVEMEWSRRLYEASVATTVCLADLGYPGLDPGASLQPETAEKWFGPDDVATPPDDSSAPGWPNTPEFLSVLRGDRSATFDIVDLDGSIVGGQTVALDGCEGRSMLAEFGSARAYVSLVNDVSLVQELVNEALWETIDSPAFADLEAAWRQCMSISGSPTDVESHGFPDAENLAVPGFAEDWTACRRQVRYLETAAGLLADEIEVRVRSTPQVEAIIARL